MSVLEKLRRAREVKLDIGGFSFTLRRPTDLEMLELRHAMTPRNFIRYVVDWGQVSELALGVPGGEPHPLAFDADVCAEWLADRPDLLVPIYEKLLELYEAHTARLGAAEKK